MKKIISALLAVVMLLTVISVPVLAAEGETVILYTNDVHCAIEDYAVLAAYKAQLEAEGNTVILVDAGDAIQGEVIGTLTEGEAVVDIMNAVGYDYAVPGNHEYDYGMETFLDLAENKAGYEYISSNFYYLPGVSGVFEPYAIEDVGDYQIAFVGITTPESVSKANPDYFKDESGNLIYGFPTWDMKEGVLFENIQESVDDAIAEGADIVVAVGHLGILETTDGWKSTDVIANTNGIDYFVDAHSHETIRSAEYKNKDDESVMLSSTGTKFANFGQLTIKADGSAVFELINPDNVDVEAMSDGAKTVYNTVKAKIDGYNAQIAYLNEVIGTSEAELIVYEDDDSWAVRKRETNAGDFVADAYRAVTGADIAICNGGGIRSEIAVGDVTRKMLMDMNPWSNAMCVVEITGQQLLDVLEHGARSCPEPLGGFFQVSGITFEIHTYRETPVATDTSGNFESIDETMERRVENVLVGGEPVASEAKYTVAGTQYVLTSGGDGLTMLDGARVLQQEGLLCDSEMLIKYLEMLGGKIPAYKYGNPDGDGRIKIIDKDPDAFDYDYEIKYGETITVSAPDYDSGEFAYVKFVPGTDGKFILESDAGEGIDPTCKLYDADMEYLESNDDSNGLNFCMEYDFTAGETYYFAVAAYSQEAEFEISLVCGHNYEDGVCTSCGNECDHEITAKNPCLCECGEFFTGKDIQPGDGIEFDSAEYDNESTYFRFVPEESGAYIFESVSETEGSDPGCSLYNSEFENIGNSDDVNGYDFLLVCELEAGETYFFHTWNALENAVCTVKLSRAVHTAADGTEHGLEYTEESYSTCTEHGYTEGLYCPDCDEYISGHEEKELSDRHPDDDENGFCDECGEEIVYEECAHICHKGGILGFFWKIVLFFSRLFGSNQICECGEYHYGLIL